MKLYYEDAQVKLFCGDCREVLSSLPECLRLDALITDPPYNVGKDYGVSKDSLSDCEYERLMFEVAEYGRVFCNSQAWVAPRYKMGLFLRIFPEAHLVVIRRGAAGPYRGGWSDQFETALVVGKPSRPIPDLWDDVRLKGEGYFFREETYGHPGYTPFPIMARFCSVLAAESVLEPFAGTGTTLVAAKQRGLKAIGIELNEAYCEIAARRLSEDYLPLNTAPEPTPKQEAFI